MTRDAAYQILTKHLTNPKLMQHSFAAEAAMRALATKLGQDEETWGITGLLHDADYEKAKGHPEDHGLLLFKLEPNTIPSIIEHAINAHNYQFTKVLPASPLDWAITCCDQLTGLIVAATLVTKEKKLSAVTLPFVLKKLKEKSFAKGADRTQMYYCEEKLGLSLEEFVEIVLKAMQGIAPQLGL